jgi:GTP pyrophosphokinase
MRRAGLSLARVLERGELEELAQQRRGGVDDLLAAIGYGKVPAPTVVRAVRPDWKPETAPQPAPEPARERPARGPKLLELFRRQPKAGEPKASSTGIRVEGQGDVLVRFANCCTPLPGDDVVGFVTRGRGVTVHQKDCRVVFHLDPQRRVDVEWDAAAQVARRIRMKVTSRDEPGLLAKVTKTISAAGINIGAARVATHPDRTATQSFDLWVSDVSTLASVMKEIERIKGILSVERMRA